MKGIFVLIFMLLSTSAYSQSEKIIYILSDSVEVALKRQIDRIRHDEPRASFSCLLSLESDGLSSMSLIKNEERSTNEHLKWLVVNSNRYLLIDKERIPLILDYDFKFGTSDLEHIGNIGKREGEIRRSALLFHGYTIYFDAIGKVVRISNY